MDRGYTKEQIEASQEGENFAWDARTIPPTFDPVQLDLNDVPAQFTDWWNTRSPLFCCLFPCGGCLSGHGTIDSTNPDLWKAQLENPNPGIPESMQGLWWLKYNIAHEELVTIFGDAELTGTFNEEGTDGYGLWAREFRHNWSREKSCFGYVLGINANRGDKKVTGRMNLKEGILTVNTGLGDGNQVIYKVNDNEWWKVHYAGNPGEALEQEIIYMYKWLKVLDKDCNKTEHWDDYVQWSTAPLPHSNCGTSWFPCWPACLSKKKVLENMTYPNRNQIVKFKN